MNAAAAALAKYAIAFVTVWRVGVHNSRVFWQASQWRQTKLSTSGVAPAKDGVMRRGIPLCWGRIPDVFRDFFYLNLGVNSLSPTWASKSQCRC